MKRYHTVVIGAGQAGLAMGYYLKQLKQSFVILDKANEIGQEWSLRYDSLILFTPRMYSSLPGLDLTGNAHGFPTKDEIANYLKLYVETFQIPVQLSTEVTHVQRENNHFVIRTNHQEYEAINLVIATGPFQKPRIPKFAQDLSADILQLHSSQYKKPDNLKSGKALVVGGGNSGAQIAVELSKEKETYLSISQKMMFLPLQIGNKSIFWWFDKLGILKVHGDSRIGRKIRGKGDPIFGFELKSAIKQGRVIQKGRTVHGERSVIWFQDNSMLKVENIIWATGFMSDYHWLDIQGVLDQQGRPLHNNGKTQIDGLYFLGLPWQSRRGSALLQGVGNDAQYLVELIKHGNE
ncbi:oxidoreductase [Virgibacillus soli]|nr:oxidoreductase [Virgibacillus soli]